MMDTKLRCAIQGAGHSGELRLVELYMELRVPGTPHDTAPLRLILCEGCIREAREHLKMIRDSLAGGAG